MEERNHSFNEALSVNLAAERTGVFSLVFGRTFGFKIRFNVAALFVNRNVDLASVRNISLCIRNFNIIFNILDGNIIKSGYYNTCVGF